MLLHSSLATLSNNGALTTPKYIQDNRNDEFRYSDHRMIITEIVL